MTFTTDIKTRTWIAKLPKWARPYAYLARWDRPTGVWLLLAPSLWAILGASHKLATAFSTSFLFFIGAILMRGAGCTINDMADQDIDDKVQRTKGRPLPSGQVTFSQALAFLGAQLAAAFIILIQFNSATIMMGIASLGLVAIYPFMKRLTHWPQAFLGLTMNWGALMGWLAVQGSFSFAPFVLYLGCFFWTLGYDTIYGHMDRADDMLVGVKSTSLLLGENTKKYLIFWYVGFALSFLGYGFLIDMGSGFFIVYGVMISLLAWQVMTFNMNNPAKCLKLFKSNAWVGALGVFAIIGGKL